MPPTRTGKSTSCAECRRLKVRCDLSIPCGHCTKRGLASICPDGELTNGLRGQRVLAGTEELHRRVAALEAALRSSSPSHPLLQGGPINLETMDSINNYSHLVVGTESERTRYFGAASSAYLSCNEKLLRKAPTTAHLQRQLAPILSDTPHLFDIPLPTSVQGNRTSSEAVQYIPDKAEAERLAALYYQNFGSFTNIVPLKYWTSHILDPIYHQSRPPPQRLCVFFLILALGCCMDTPSNDDLVDLYAHAARLSFAVDPSHSVTLVQAIYLYVTFVMNGRRDRPGGETGWLFLRSGMAAAEAIGLHRDPAQWSYDEEEANLRRTIFYEIHGYDVLQSIALGRGQCISDSAIDCQYPEDGDETMFHRKAYELTRHWSRINERQIRTIPSTYTEVCAIDDGLAEYEKALPDHLSSSSPPSLLDFSDPQKRRLLFRRTQLLMYLAEARMALHRAWFVRVIKEFPLDPMQSPQSRSFVCCLEACRTIVALVRNALAMPEQRVSRRWHYWFHLFSACACLAACVIRVSTNPLARLVFTDLEYGIELFRANQRVEWAQLDILRSKAQAALRGEKAEETEDLDLLGAQATLRRDITLENGNGALHDQVEPEFDFAATEEVITVHGDLLPAQNDYRRVKADEKFLEEIGLSTQFDLS